jgi:hypothetical protein
MADSETGLLFSPAGAYNSIRDHAKTIARRLRERAVQFLCGAGMSRPLGLPLSSHLAKSFLADLFSVGMSDEEQQGELKELADRYSLESIAGAYLKKKDDPSLAKLVAESVGEATGDVHESRSHKALAYLANNGYIDRIYTTNFDLLIERLLAQRACTITDLNVSSLPHELGKKIPVIHLHGVPETGCRITELETYQLDTPISDIFKADLVTHHFVMVGYRLADADLRGIYFQLQEKLNAGRAFRKPYVVHTLGRGDKAPVSYLEAELARLVWEARGATFVPAAAEEFLPAIVDSLRRLEVEQEAQSLAEKFGLDPQSEDAVNEVWNRARSLCTELGIRDEVKGLKMLAQRHGVKVRP